MRKSFLLIMSFLILISVGLIIFTTWKLKAKHKTLKGKYKNMIGATYVGSQECKKCHERKYLEWKATLHAKIMQDVKENPMAILGDFSHPKVQGFKKDLIEYVLGSKWKQQYLIREGDTLYTLPIQYNIWENTWEVAERKDWFKECAGCHATGVDLTRKTFKEPGVGCEACHGPGSNHVEAMPGYEITTIINPARLTPLASAQLCGSCHSIGKDKAGHPYPSQYLSIRGVGNLYNYFSVDNQKTNPQAFWPSGEAKVPYGEYNDWLMSAHAEAGITCINCHFIHEPKIKVGQMGLPPSQTRQIGDNLCKSCHQTTENRMVHRIHTFGSCIECHMPKIAKITKGRSYELRSHSFNFLSPELTIRFGAGNFDRQPNSCSGCHYHKKTNLLDLVEFLDAAKKGDMPLPFSAHRRPERWGW